MSPAAALNPFQEIVEQLDRLDWLGLALVLVLLCLLVYLIWRRKYSAESGKAPLALAVPKKLSLPPDCLAAVWRGFVAAIPWRLRADALSAPLSLVIGDAGSGKTAIIDRYANWQGQDFSFQPSAINDPLLQIYLGAKALVLEFGATLLYDTHPAAYTAIKNLWRRLPPKPQAVMAIDAGTLLSPQTEQLRQSGHVLFGKLKIFGKLEGKPLPLILALSHMDEVPGFLEFCRFSEREGIPLQIEFPDKDGIDRLEACLDSFHQHLPRALVTCSAQDYLKIVGFLHEVPQLLKVLIDFLRVSGMEEDLAALPVVRLCLLSEQAKSFGCRPFALQSGRVKQPFISLNAHAKAALVLVCFGLFYLIGSYSYQQGEVAKVRKGIQLVATTPVQYYPDKISPLFLDFSSNLHKNALLSFMPNFFSAVDKENNYLLIVEIRKYYLLPLLKQIQLEPDASFKTFRFLGLLYATPTNEINKILAKHPERNPFDMTKYGLLFADYLKYNTRTDELDPLLNQITYSKAQSYIEDHTPWIALFRNYQQILKKPYLQETEFKSLQNDLASFLGILNRLDYYTDQREINQWLLQHTNLRLENNNQSELRQDGIGQLLGLVSNLKLSDRENCLADLSLNECLELVQATANVKADNATADMLIRLDGESFAFTSAQWNALMTRSRISMMLRSLIKNHINNDGWVFFNSASLYNDLELNGSNSGKLLFAGKARVDGRLTVDAFEQNVKPVVMKLPDIVAGLPIDPNEKKYFIDFVMKNLNTYSDNYVNAYLNYFRQFQVRIDSVWALNFVLDDLQQPNSQLLETLVRIKTNTALSLPSTAGFSGFAQKLAVFRFIQHLMEEKNGAYPEFQKYQLMMAQMQHEMDPNAPYVPKKTRDQAASLKGALTPIARVAWAMSLNEEGSYLTLAKSWLENAGILDNWQQPFLAPVQKVKEFGTAEINQHLDSLWTDIWESNVVPQLQKFPFSSYAERDNELSLDELIRIFHPKQGVFWVTFTEYLSPLVNLSNGVWVKPYDLSDSLALPKDFLLRLNAVQQLTASLWDVQGNPKPLELFVKPGLLPTFDNKQIPNPPLVALTYLRNGGVSVLGFNQQADWQKLNLEWWTLQPAEVGMEFRKDANPTRVYTDRSVTDSAWNFFRLVQEGEVIDVQRYRWLLAHPNFPQQPLSLEFSFRANPFAVFANLAGR